MYKLLVSLGGDYAKLREGREGEVLLVFSDPGADWSTYESIKLDPVTIWAGEASAFDDFSAKDRQVLADTFYSTVRYELSEDYPITEGLGARVMQVQIALTDAQASSPAMDTISSVVPIGLALSQAKGFGDRQARFRGRSEHRGSYLGWRDRSASRSSCGSPGRRQVDRRCGRLLGRRAGVVPVLGAAATLPPLHRPWRLQLRAARGLTCPFNAASRT